MLARAVAPRRLRLVLALPILVLGLLASATPVAAVGPVSDQLAKNPPIGYDISYPQCGSPYPRSAAFTIVGVNGGRVYSANPCLAAPDGSGQLAWGGPGVEFYANTANPGPELSSYWPRGQVVPRPCDTVALPGADTVDCAYDYGWNAAADSYRTAVNAAITLGLAPAGATRTPRDAFWWLDVETVNSWRGDPARNVAALQGARDYLESMRVAGVGFYSTPRMWAQITGDSDVFSRHPSWVAGASTGRGAMASCEDEGFTGGPVRYAQYFKQGFDANHRC
ncbi:MAG: hypothetical protein ABI534_05580 [Chloroflexota bacterium]